MTHVLQISIMQCIELAEKQLQKKGYRMTGPRKKVLLIIANSKIPMGAYEIREKIKNTIDISTIYRILYVFEKEGFIHRMQNQKFVHCQASSCNNCNHCHHQFICSNCSQIEEIHIDDQNFIHDIQKKYPHINIQNHSLELSGYCSECTHSSFS